MLGFNNSLYDSYLSGVYNLFAVFSHLLWHFILNALRIYR